ncbi:MAG: HD domain-containing protein [Clostridia bacterium]|nr:HD domain-containing protein [Clostridia bacterium]
MEIENKHKKLLNSIEFNMLLFDVCPIGIAIYKSNGDCVAANKAAATITGQSIAEFENVNFNNIKQWQDSGFLSIVQCAINNSRPTDVDVQLQLKDACSAVWLKYRVVPFLFESKCHLLLTFADITEKKNIEERNRLYVEELESALTQTVSVIRTLGEMRDPYTAGHERRVGDLAAAIGAELGFDDRRQQGLRIAGYLHDIGKIAAPAEILVKPGRLSPAEFELIKGHSAKGYEILSNVDFPWPVALVALQHHERMDGSGYPQGIKGEQITLKARIVAVADVVDAMSSHRPYRPALGIENALAEIERGKGTKFDADATDACLRLFRQKGYEFQD